jgi:hypothetical protein
MQLDVFQRDPFGAYAVQAPVRSLPTIMQIVQLCCGQACDPPVGYYSSIIHCFLPVVSGCQY